MEESCQYSSAEISARTWAIQYIPKCSPVKKGGESETNNFAADAKLDRLVRMWAVRRIVPGLHETE